MRRPCISWRGRGGRRGSLWHGSGSCSAATHTVSASEHQSQHQHRIERLCRLLHDCSTPMRNVFHTWRFSTGSKLDDATSVYKICTRICNAAAVDLLIRLQTPTSSVFAQLRSAPTHRNSLTKRSHLSTTSLTPSNPSSAGTAKISRCLFPQSLHL